jgi:hypothetical protein
MTTTKSRRPSDDSGPFNDPFILAKMRQIISKIKSYGASQLSPNEQVALAELHRLAALKQTPLLKELSQAVPRAQFEYCMRLPCNSENKTNG